MQFKKKKFDNIIGKSTGLKLLKNISKLIRGESVNFNDFPVQNFKYALITSVDVERSFCHTSTMF